MMNFGNTIDDPSLKQGLVKQSLAPASSAARTPPLGGASKRAFDLCLALTGILCLLPLIVLVAGLVWMTDGGNPFFGHTRIGCDGRLFKCLKFRSMVRNSAEVMAALLAKDPDAAREWAQTQKLRNDPRITTIGRVLRVSSVDELPQLFNVLMGQMSLVGPRPIVAGEVERYGADIKSYCACRPGLTGLWQISGRSDCSYAERVGFDVSYADHWSLWRDAVIVARTVPAILQRKGSY